MTSIVWTARLAMSCYALRLLLEMRGGDSTLRKAWSRRLWTAGWLTMVVHFAYAFHVRHGWSHAAAVADTARRTEEVVGWHWGGGIWFNYAFLLLWGLDVARMWNLFRLTPTIERRWLVALHSFMAFMAFNATAVFGPRWWIPVVAVYAAVLAGLYNYGSRRTQRAADGA